MQVKTCDSIHKHTERLLFSTEVSRAGPGWGEPAAKFKEVPKYPGLHKNNIPTPPYN